MKILLINPPSEIKHNVLPLGLASLAAFMRERNHEVSVIDAWAMGYNYNELEKIISETKPDLTGITLMSPRFNQGKLCADASKRALPDVPVILGGPHPSAMPRETLTEIEFADICVIGEGEITFAELAEALSGGKDVTDIRGIAYRNKNSEIIVNSPRESISDMDSLPFPVRELFPVSAYKTHPPYGRRNPYMSMITGRGCPFRCAYCSKEVFGKKLRMQSPKRVVDEMEYLIKRYGVKEIHFYDDDFTMNMKRTADICDEIIRRNIRIIWSCTTRVDLVSEDLLRKMKQAGCWMISYGVESGNQKILDTIQKGITLQKIRDTFRITREAGIKRLAFLMVGLPGETRDTIDESVRFSLEIDPDFVGWGVLIVFPGSPFYNMVMEGKFGGEKKLRDLSTEQFAKRLVFEDNLTVEELEAAAAKANRDFYRRPAYIFRRILEIRSPEEFIHYFKAGLDILR
jgi:anaerobic magnesium-protoporphyrin IX monomethyl ester cyclase